MAHAPELPEKYVCTDCQTLHAGTVTEHTDSGHHYEPPAECGCCGAVAFVTQESWPHHHD